MGRKTTTGVVGTATPQINITSNTITTTVVNSDLTLTPNGTGKVTTANAVAFTNSTASTSVSTGALVVSGGVGIGGALFTTGAISTASTTASTSTSTGSLIAAGGIGVAGAAYIGGAAVVTGAISTASTTASTSTSTGSLIAAGGAGIAGALNVGGATALGGTLSVTGLITASAGSSGIIGWSIVTSAQTLADADSQYLVIPSSSYTVTLPATSTNGRVIKIGDGGSPGRRFGNNNITIGRNGNTIAGTSENLVLNISGSMIEMVYYNGDWKVFKQV